MPGTARGLPIEPSQRPGEINAIRTLRLQMEKLRLRVEAMCAKSQRLVNTTAIMETPTLDYRASLLTSHLEGSTVGSGICPLLWFIALRATFDSGLGCCPRELMAPEALDA